MSGRRKRDRKAYWKARRERLKELAARRPAAVSPSKDIAENSLSADDYQDASGINPRMQVQDNDVNLWVQDLFEATGQDSADNDDVLEHPYEPMEDPNDPKDDHDEYDYNYPSSSDEDVEDECEDEIESPSNLEEVIRTWAVNNDAITLAMVQDLVDRAAAANLMERRDARTIMKTPRGIQSLQISGCEVYTYCVKTQLQMLLKRYPHHLLAELEEFDLQLSIDGLPLFKASGASFWPLLVTVKNLWPSIVVPLVIAHCPGSKPSDTDFLNDAIDQLVVIQNEGLVLEDKLLQIADISLVADIPARAFIKYTISHSGKNCCGRCTAKGVKPLGGGICFLNANIRINRTDDSFRRKIHRNHHKPPGILHRE